MQIYNRATGTTASPLEILVMAVVLGGTLIVWGLLDATNTRRGVTDVLAQVIVGALNTVLLCTHRAAVRRDARRRGRLTPAPWWAGG